MIINKDLLTVIFIFIVYAACYGQSQYPKLVDDSSLKLSNTTALLNGSLWHGKVEAVRSNSKISRNKAISRFDASFLTYLPYITYLSHDKGTDTVTRSVPNQWLSINNIPSSVGVFKLLTFDSSQSLKIKVRYDLFDGGDAISDSYYLEKDTANQIEILAYDSKTGIISGLFKLNLIDSSGKKIRFENGIFKARIVEKSN